MTESGGPSVGETSVEAELAAWGDARVYFEPMWGNHGDRLIVMGSEAALAESGVRMVDDVCDADRIVVKGGGYLSGGAWLPHIAELIGQADETPVMIMPSSFEDPTEVLSLAAARRGPTTIYMREQTSLRLARDLSASSQIDLRLDHDMAFRLNGSVYMQRMRQRSQARTRLIVERTDAESVSGRQAKSLGPTWLKAHLPERLKLSIKRKMRQASARYRGATTDFAASTLRYLDDREPEYAGLPVIAGDIARNDFCSFAEFEDYVARAGVVVTTRLHVGILAALLGKQTHLVPGTYHKLAAVYEHSMAQLAGVHLVDMKHFVL